MIYIGKNPKLIEEELLKLLHLVFRAKLNAAEKKERLKTEYDIEIDNEVLKEMNIMCNLGEGLVEETWEEATFEHLKKIMKSMKINLEQAMNILEVPTANRSIYTSLMQ